jgi:phenylalanyl-tRNA synthetase beta chain
LVKTIHKNRLELRRNGSIANRFGSRSEVVEKYQSIKGGLEGIVVGHVLTCVPHPDADRLKNNC